ncbi:MAG: phytanoyl-CoA dioxygenase family protein [Gammaproteobacteria bacterium]|nr:phytanoyl-CoA dioxygenase family protein [Gammaproteobacteria bacterium]
MKLSAEQLCQFQRDGLLLLPDLFSAEEVEILRSRLPKLFAEDVPANIREKESHEVRTAMGLHLRDEIYARLVRHPRLLEPAMQILNQPLYVQQVKVNVKAAFCGEPWQWHYDFATHHSEDGVPKPLALNLHVFLDDVTEFNGPLYFIPGSHNAKTPAATLDTTSTSYPLWVVDQDTVKALAKRGSLVSATGRAGTGLIFGDVMLHASPSNISPFDRKIFSLIVNPVSNALTRHQRPDHNHHRDLTPVTPLDDDCLLH